MTPTSMRARLLLAGVLLAATATTVPAQVRLADESDRSAFRSWFTLLADAQFEQPAPEVTDCAALVRFAFREALRAHTPEWSRRTALPFTPRFPDVKSAPRATFRGVAAVPGQRSDAATLRRVRRRPHADRPQQRGRWAGTSRAHGRAISSTSSSPDNRSPIT